MFKSRTTLVVSCVLFFLAYCSAAHELCETGSESFSRVRSAKSCASKCQCHLPVLFCSSNLMPLVWILDSEEYGECVAWDYQTSNRRCRLYFLDRLTSYSIYEQCGPVPPAAPSSSPDPPAAAPESEPKPAPTRCRIYMYGDLGYSQTSEICEQKCREGKSDSVRSYWLRCCV